MDRKDEKNMQKLYTAWGTTREDHMAQMMKLVDCLNAQVADKVEDAEPSAPTKMAVTIRKRAAIKNRTAASDRIMLFKPGISIGRNKTQMKVAGKYYAKKEPIGRETIETEGLGLDVVKMVDGKPAIVRTRDGRLMRLRMGGDKPIRNVKNKLQKGRRKRK